MIDRSITAGIPVRLGSSILFMAVAIAVAVLPAPPAAQAHHSFAMFDANQTLSTTATVKEFQWGSPHTWLELVVLNEDKTEKPLSLELTTISGLLRNGWKPGTLKPGDPEGAVKPIRRKASMMDSACRTGDNRGE
jgi:hypothetical protein